MKVLLRSNYQWVDAKLDIKRNRIVTPDVNESVIYLTEIVSIENHDRKKYVKCNHCGTIIRKNAKAIATHKDKSKTSQTCMSCEHMRKNGVITQSKRYVLNEDGTYTVSTKQKCSLYCSYGYYINPDINSEGARKACRYAPCASSDVMPLTDTFIEYPAVFDTLATVDALDKKKWTLDYKDGENLRYRLKSRKMQFTAVVAFNGVIDHFEIVVNRRNLRFAYSAKYHKIFWFDGSIYATSWPYYCQTNQKDELLNICQEIYKEEK